MPVTSSFTFVLIIVLVYQTMLFGYFVFTTITTKKKPFKPFMTLLFFMIIYNLTGYFLPTDAWSLDFQTQVTISYIAGLVTGIQFLYFSAKALNVPGMSTSTTAVIISSVVYVGVTIITYASGLIDLRTMETIVPIVPIVGFGLWSWKLIKTYPINIYRSFVENGVREIKPLLFIATGMFSFILMFPILAWDLGKTAEHMATNLGFVFMSFYLLNTSMRDHKRILLEHEQLLRDLQLQVDKRTESYHQAVRRQSQVVNMVTHELKTPLMIAINHIDNLRSTMSITAQSSDYLRLGELDKSVYKIDRLMKMFSLSEQMNISFPFNKKEVLDLNSYLERVTNVYREATRDTKIAFDYTTSIDKTALFSIDADAIDSLLENIINNAIKYTPRKQIASIHISLNKEGNFFCLKVEDQGIGMSKEFLPKATEYSVKADVSTEGVGIGLSLVTAICKQYKIVLDIESEIGRGTIVKLQFPIEEKYEIENVLMHVPDMKTSALGGYSSEHITIEHSIDQVGTYKPYVLLVEDQAEILNLMIKSMSTDFNIYAFTSPAEAMEFLINNEYEDLNVIVSDFYMPEMTGIEFIESIQSLSSEEYGHIKDLPFILTSTAGEADSVQLNKYYNTGIYDYMAKPIVLNHLVSKIGRLVDLQGQNSHREVAPMKKNETIEDIKGKHNLTPAETKMFTKLLGPLTYDQIGLEIHIAETTVATHARSIYRKVGVKKRVEFTAKFREFTF